MRTWDDRGASQAWIPNQSGQSLSFAEPIGGQRLPSIGPRKEGEIDRKVYRATREGRKALVAAKSKIQELFREVVLLP